MAAQWILAGAALFAAVAGIAQFTIRRATLATDVDIEFRPLPARDARIADFTVVVRNLGFRPLRITRVAYQVKYRLQTDEVVCDEKLDSKGERKGDEVEPRLPRKLSDPKLVDKEGWLHFPDVPPRAIAFPGGAARFGKPLRFPQGAEIASLTASCDYEVSVGRPSRLILWLFVHSPPDDNFTRGVADHMVRRTVELDEPRISRARDRELSESKTEPSKSELTPD